MMGPRTAQPGEHPPPWAADGHDQRLMPVPMERTGTWRCAASDCLLSRAGRIVKTNRSKQNSVYIGSHVFNAIGPGYVVLLVLPR